MDYFKIRQRIRKYGKPRGLSQGQLAEETGISIVHMSHIETGNTKRSLPIFVSIAHRLDVQADELLSDEGRSRRVAIREISKLLDTCTAKQLQILSEPVDTAKASMDKYGIG